MEADRYNEYKGRIKSVFSDCDDFMERDISSNGAKCTVMYLRGITSRDYLSEKIIRPLAEYHSELQSFSGDYRSLLRTASVFTPPSAEVACERIIRGDVLVLVCVKNGFFPVLAGAQTEISRDVSEPMSDVTVRGPKAGFTEDAEKNMVMLRQYIRTPDLKFRRFTLGSLSNTKVMLAYVKGRAPDALVSSVADRLAGLSSTAIVDSANVSMLLTGKSYSFIPTVGSTEKVDKCASKLMSGRIAVIADGSPFVLTIPYLFVESIQSSDDYFHTPVYATFIRALRFVAFVAAVFAPAVLIAFFGDVSRAPDHPIGEVILSGREDLPMDLFFEICAVLLLFELLREVGVRMPRTVGDAVGIVGSIILGDAAVNAGFVSSVAVITVALSAVCAFMTPAFMYVTVISRLAILMLARLFGIYGVCLGAFALGALMFGQSSFGVPFMYPFAPFSKKGMQDCIFTDPKKTLGRNEIKGETKW